MINTKEEQKLLSNGLANFNLQNNKGLRLYLDDYISKVRQETIKEVIEMIPPQDELAGWGDDTDYAKGYRDGYKQANGEFKHRLQSLSINKKDK